MKKSSTNCSHCPESITTEPFAPGCTHTFTLGEEFEELVRKFRGLGTGD